MFYLGKKYSFKGSGRFRGIGMKLRCDGSGQPGLGAVKAFERGDHGSLDVIPPEDLALRCLVPAYKQ